MDTEIQEPQPKSEITMSPEIDKLFAALAKAKLG